MTWPVDIDNLGERLDLRNDRVSNSDALRQHRTIAEILRRLGNQPGIVLADEVGMGKTFVALGVAMVAALTDRRKRPVVIMVPSSLHEKWPRDFAVFTEHVVKHAKEKLLRAKPVSSALEFFRLIDSETENRPQIIFLKHGAFHVQNIDQWVRLALIKRAISGMHLGEKRDALPRFAATLLRTKSSYSDPELFAKLLRVPNREWRHVINDHCPDLQLTDAPIPDAIQKVLESSDIDVAALRECLRELPARESISIGERLERTRRAINDALRAMWPSTLAKARFRSPLLILDEAHHLKNPATRLASLFVTDEAREDAGTITGALDGSFERMMFLTATPFQLGHHEMLNVIGRFKGIAWKTLPQYTKEQFEAEMTRLGETLDRAQHRSAELDKRWSSLRQEDLIDPNGGEASLDDWLRDTAACQEERPERIQIIIRAFQQARIAMKESEVPLRKWVIRHLRDSMLPGTSVPRRSRRVGRAISLSVDGAGGLPVGDDALLPFLLAARAQAVVVREGIKAGRATFAEGLASSYEAFLQTRHDGLPDEDEQGEDAKTVSSDELVNRYIEKLAAALPDEAAYAQHPKIAPVVARVLDLWQHREKVVVFCHYRETSRAIVRHLSAALERELWSDAAQRFELEYEDVRKAVDGFGARFDTDGGMRQPLRDELVRRLEPYKELCGQEREQIHNVVRRFVRTPSFVVRYFDIRARSGASALQKAFDTCDRSGVSLDEKINAFLKFIVQRCSPQERHDYLDALIRMQPGIRGETQRDTDDLSQIKGANVMPNIRLANGLVKQETRQRLMLAFNTPFFPEILVASSVLAEGVDLHLSCRHVIHHDLSWNPSTLEQRTGRVDRIGAMAETVAKPIEVFLPYVGGTQDEKQFRVVMDRERWFQVLMGADYRTDESFTEKAAERVPLPAAAAKALAFDLSVKSASTPNEYEELPTVVSAPSL